MRTETKAAITAEQREKVTRLKMTDLLLMDQSCLKGTDTADL
jgi:hypothetical protein